ncbi:ComEA family DNA-binding protein [Chitinophaga nivalis]|uniref:Helix-hairpin-helix domain-containing protein n=1 Tax=Chitinophaga nivalis TaxID=2991709 RepID=A0ABT3IF84_9BACT|nr:helix-hairpin-helix domain-containing protein [Chitinophaga nivalis]MCW3467698.1 helix-hairpin-helix domain-containing protein [Chitinophaga nivalis]MCW3482610.1 helix-hairpin-helix domain-containing protein [Chitinophaga nivalis]
MATIRNTCRRIICCTGLLLCLLPATARRQEEVPMPAVLENNLEQEMENTTTVQEDDAQWQRLNTLARHKIPLNRADEAMLQSLGILTPVQINNFLRYRQLLGELVSIYELQAIPGFDPELIRRILPYVAVGNDLAPHYSLRDYLHKGDHSLLMRYGQVMEKAKGYQHTDSTLPYYRGSPGKMFIRYRYNFSHYISAGVVMEKDAGEAFFKGAQRLGFDFYSAHIFINTPGKIKALALGDYTISMGQGLLNWQSQAYGKGAAVMQIKREGEVLRPYTSAGEFYFFRGAAITLQQQKLQLTGFVSHRLLDGSTDTLEDERIATAVMSSGYHRSINEIAKRGVVQQRSAGGNLRLTAGRWQAGANVIWHSFVPGWQKTLLPYNQFDFNGQQLLGASVDYAGSWKNVHLFGEAAWSDNGKPAIVQGLLTTIAPAIDMAMVYRYYDRAYQALYAKGFGDNYRTVNENGWYTALSVRLHARLKLDTYADLFRFPWLKYRANAPGTGKTFFVQGTYTPNKKVTTILTYHYRQSEENTTLPDNPMKVTAPVTQQHIRLQWSRQPGKKLGIRTRLEYSRWHTSAAIQQGWLLYQEVSYHFQQLPLQVNVRITRFFADSYDTRIYAAESSVLYDNAVSMLYGNGWQYYGNLKWKINRRLSCWLRCHQTLYPGASAIGSGYDVMEGNHKTMWQCQLQQLF